MSYRSAERVETQERRQYHLGAAPGEVADLVLLLGDPERAQKVAARFSNLRFSCQNRDYHVYTGTHRGRELSVICVGMGSACMEIAVVELCQIVRDPILIRAGSSGALQTDIQMGLGALHYLATMRQERTGLPHWHAGLSAAL